MGLSHERSEHPWNETPDCGIVQVRLLKVFQAG